MDRPLSLKAGLRFRLPRQLGVLGTLLMLALSYSTAPAAAERVPHILYIASYHPAFHSFADQSSGFEAGLTTAGYPAEKRLIDYEFLDSKRFPYKERAEHLDRDLARKMQTLTPYDIVVVADDNALKFAIERQDSLFNGTQIVFLGVNNISLAKAQDANPRIVGVVEHQSIGPVLDLATRVFPNAPRIHATHARLSATSKVNDRLLANAINGRPGQTFVRHSFSHLTYAEFFAEMATVPKSEPIFLGSFYRDAAGQTLGARAFFTRLRQVYDGPVFMSQRHSIGAGAFGGKVVSHFEQGRAAAGLAGQYLGGKDPATMKVIVDSPNIFLVDHAELTRHGVPVDRLPADTILINQPVSPFGEYGRWAFGGLIVFALQLALILVLFSNRRHRRRAENALRESEARLRAFFDNSPSVMYVKDRAHKMVTVNSKYLELYNLAEVDVIGMRGGQSLDAKRRKQAEAADDTVLRSGASTQETAQIVGAAGERRSYIMTKFPIADSEGVITGIGGINTDVTELQDREQKLVEAKADAERAMREAQEANRTKSEFLANMSHEIRTPMNGVLGAATVLANSEMTAAQQENVDTIRESGAALLGLLNDILDLSKVEAGHMALEKTDFSLTALLRSTAALWEGAAQDKGLTFKIENNVSSRDAFRGDSNRMRQILNNLVGNALKFTSQGGVTVTVSETARPETAAGGTELLFQVGDTGIGITEEQRVKLFRPFTQADASTTRKFGGTGLGLSICSKLVEMLGGEIRIESRPGEGSTFSFDVTVEPGDVRKIARCAPADPESTLPQFTLDRQLRILLAEDNPVNRKIVTWLLAPLDCQLDVATTGLEAVAAVTRSSYDLVLMDVQMPEMDGTTAARKIRELPEPVASVPIIALTANAMHGDRERYLSAGMNGYVAKPIDQRELFSAIGTCLELQEGAGGPLPAAAPAPTITESSGESAGASSAAALFDDLDDLIAATGSKNG